jgi:hypothetical protein
MFYQFVSLHIVQEAFMLVSVGINIRLADF